MKLKVCGVRNMAMTQACQDNLVDYIGFNFVPTSKRRIDLELAQGLSHAFTGRKVGVFQNPSLEAVIKTLQIVDLDIIQLHGQESPEFIALLLEHLSSTTHHRIQIWKAFSITEKFDSKVLQQYSKNCDLFLFDGQKPGSGTQIGDTNILIQAIKAATKLNIPYGLAGGINSESVAIVLQESPKTYLVDTASGIENEKNQFSADKLRTMVKLVHDE